MFQDRALGIFDSLDNLETRIVRTLAEGIQALLAENFDAFIIEGEPEAAFDQATHARQHFPSLRIACLITERGSDGMQGAAFIPSWQLLFGRWTFTGDRAQRESTHVIHWSEI